MRTILTVRLTVDHDPEIADIDTAAIVALEGHTIAGLYVHGAERTAVIDSVEVVETAR